MKTPAGNVNQGMGFCQLPGTPRKKKNFSLAACWGNEESPQKKQARTAQPGQRAVIAYRICRIWIISSSYI